MLLSPAVDRLAPPLAAVELTNIHSDYDGNPALDDLSASIPRGQITALCGANGSGKSTLLGVIAGIQPHRSGSVVRHGSPTVAIVVQHSAVTDRLPITVRDAVTIGRWGALGSWRRLRASDRDIVDESIAAVALGGLERRPLHSLSGGQRQRALVAQGLARRADLLLLDEPTAAIDAETHGLIVAAMHAEIRRGTTIVHATHDEQLAAQADRRITLAAGRVVEVLDR